MVNARKDFLWVAEAEAETAAAFQTTVWSRSTPHHGGLVVVYSKGTRLLILKKGRPFRALYFPSFLFVTTLPVSPLLLPPHSVHIRARGKSVDFYHTIAFVFNV